MSFFVRLTLVLAAVFAALAVLAILVKLVVAAAIISALVVASLYAYNVLRAFARRSEAQRAVRVRRC